jgi:phosphonate transport system permease protein
MSAAPALAPPARDPAWLGRVFWLGAALALLWPMLVATEFKPWLLFSPESLQPKLRAKPGARWPLPRPASRWHC